MRYSRPVDPQQAAIMGHKMFGQDDWISRQENESKHGMAYFLWYCDQCRKKQYLTHDELYALLAKTNFQIPLPEILTEKFLRWLRIPKINFTVEWRHLEELKQTAYDKQEKIAALRRSGWTLAKIGLKYGLSRQRIHQLLRG